MKVAYVTQWFPPEPIAVPVLISKELEKRGFDVKVLTGVPNYPTGEVFPGYSARKSAIEVVDGFQTLRAPLYPNHGSSTSRRALNYLSFAASSSRLANKILASSDVNFVDGSPITAALPALYAKFRWGTPYVLHVQDLWPDSVFSTDFISSGTGRSVAGTALSNLVNTIYKHASHIVAICPGMAAEIVNRGVPSDKVSFVYNWAPELPSLRTNDSPLIAGLKTSDKVLLYAGNHGYAQGLASWIEAMGSVLDLDNVKLVMIGTGPSKESLVRLADQINAKNILFLDPVSRAELDPLVDRADALVVSLADKPIFEVTMPSKTQGALAKKKAVLASGRGDLRNVIEDAGAGLVSPPEDPLAIAKMMREFSKLEREDTDAMGKRGYEYFKQHMSRDIGGEHLASVLKSATRK